MDEVLNLVQALINKFEKDINYYKNASLYNEHNCRIELIDPLLNLLGWDISNHQGKAPQFREVITENYSAETGRPDYSMTLNGVIKFHVEAKKPAVSIHKDSEPAFQTRRYGWSSNLRISILTNFEYLIIYDTSIPPKDKDDSNVAAFKKYHYTEYVDKFEEISMLISKKSIYSGDFDDNLDNNCFSVFDKGLQLPVDRYFLMSINEWRRRLGNYLYKNKGYDLEIINDCIQEFVNQIIFIRICEDRNLPLYQKLKEIAKEEELIIHQLGKLFKEADKKYNSGLFSGEYIIFDLNNEIIRDIIEELYYPKSPYQFNLIQPNILGEIYELFLAEHLVLKEHELKLQSKDKNINRDIVTTPLEIVKYMVQNTLKKVCEGKSPNEILRLSIADIACGSGIFLIEVFDYLIKYVIDWYVKNDISHLICNGDKVYKLPFIDKRLILENCIFGIDIDVHAVEVAKFNLMLKLLEDETEPMLRGIDKVLPDLKSNILFGNSLVDLHNINYQKLTETEKAQIVPFNWDKINLGNKFDVIIGNPPYVNTEDMNKLLNKKEVKVYKDKYSASKGQFDKYYMFIERSIEKLKSNGYMCYIVPNKFSKIKSGETLRELLSKNKYVKEYIDFGAEQLFKKRNKTVYSSILSLQKAEQESFKYVEVDNLSKWFANEISNEINVNTSVLGRLPWALVTNTEEMKFIDKMYENSVPLVEIADIFNGIQTSAERPPVYWFSTKDIIKETDELFVINKFNKEYKIEKNILKKYFKPVLRTEKNLGTYDAYSTDKYIIFPYDIYGKLYDIRIMRDVFPCTMEYLEDNYDLLRPKQIDSLGTRDVPLANKDSWYQYGRDQALTAFNNRKKLIVGVLSKKAMYLYDNNDLVIASGGTAGYCAISQKKNSEYELEYIQAYLTNPYTEKLLSIIGSDFEGGYYSRGTSILERIPFKVLDFNNIEHKTIYNNVVCKTRKIYEINDKIQNNKLSKKNQLILEDEKNYLIKEVEDLITKVYSI